MNDVFERLANEGSRLAKINNRSTGSAREVQVAADLAKMKNRRAAAHRAKMNDRSTFSSREVQTAVRLVLSGEHAERAVSEGTKAEGKYTASLSAK
ncbi:putative histone H2B 3 [Ditylenchus destructor]|nr:putative histone H2B 3 [Ditylenchus destructor]